MTRNPYLWLIPVLPLAGAAINGFLGRRSSKSAVTAVALVFSGAAFALALWIAAGFSSSAAPYYFELAHWIRIGAAGAPGGPGGNGGPMPPQDGPGADGVPPGGDKKKDGGVIDAEFEETGG